MSTRLPRIVALLAAVLLPGFQTLSPQSTTTRAAPQRTPQFENEDVAVWKTVIPPDAPLTMHTHQHPRVVVALSGGTMKIVYEDGGSETHTWQTGKAYWLPTSEGLKRHADVNTGSKPIEVIVVELKKAN
jgi:beta-alanine degradation protein BauB